MGQETTVWQSAIDDIRQIIRQGMETAYQAVNASQVMTYWLVGKRIVEQEHHGQDRAEYGKQLFILFPDKSIWNACVPNLSWTHFRILLRVTDEDARLWYLREASAEGWSVRTLDRNIGTQYYYRLLQAPKKDAVIAEMKEKTAGLRQNQFEMIKSPVIAEFLGFKAESSYLESDLESAILSHIRDFLMEMGRGFAFVARQQHIATDTEDYWIDLVFYNIDLRCYVLIDLKMGKITHQDVGQIDMYVRMYDDLKRRRDDNPTIGLLLCSETDADIARYSVLHDNDRLFMSKYLTYLPTQEQLRREIERQKALFYTQHGRESGNDAQEEGVQK